MERQLTQCMYVERQLTQCSSTTHDDMPFCTLLKMVRNFDRMVAFYPHLRSHWAQRSRGGCPKFNLKDWPIQWCKCILEPTSMQIAMEKTSKRIQRELRPNTCAVRTRSVCRWRIPYASIPTRIRSSHQASCCGRVCCHHAAAGSTTDSCHGPCHRRTLVR